jgi:hypothetical protein
MLVIFIHSPLFMAFLPAFTDVKYKAGRFACTGIDLALL